ncbi:CHAT domain-containing protein [Lactarius deliciosus]|nr:CHAT domain-containing protein [Lactarius deliciosus]
MDPEPSIADIDDSITFVQNSLRRYPRSHLTHITGVQTLALARLSRYGLSQQKKDLDKSILHYTEAIFLPPVSRAGPSLHVVQLLFDLASALLDRSEDFDQPGDVKYSIEYLRYLRGLPLESFDIPRNDVMKTLVQALAAQVELETGDGTRNIEEMLVLCRELLTFDLSADFPVGAFESLKQAVNAEFVRERPISLLDEVVECLRDAVKVCPPGSYEVMFALADQLSTRFFKTRSDDDYEEATVLLERILDPNLPGECPDSMRGSASSLASALALVRSVIFESPENTEMAISRVRALLSSSSIDEGIRFHATEGLSILVRGRFRDYSLTESLEEANSYLSQVAGFSSSRSLEKSGEFLVGTDGVRKTYSTTLIQQKIRHLEELLFDAPPGTERHKPLISGLADWYKTKFSYTDDISDIEESIKYSRLLLDATHPSDPWGINPLGSLRDILHLAFKGTSKIGYLDESINVGYDILKLKSAQHGHFNAIQSLLLSLLTRWRLLGRREDLDEAIRLMSLAVDNQYAQEPDRFRLSCIWALLARRIRDPSVITAYKSGLSLMRKSLSFAPTVSIQHSRLVAMGEKCQRVPLDYASYQIDLGQIEDAVETLEQGRALIWSEMRELRTPMAQFVEDGSPLAKRFAEINQELEALTTSLTPSARLVEMEDGVPQSKNWTDPFGRLVIRQQKLVEERDTLVSQIQGRPGLEGFLTAPSFATLRSAASCGPVILINHCEWRSDILILLHTSSPILIPTADDFYDCANNLRDRLVDARKAGLDSAKYQNALRSVLRDLYELVGQPVLERLQALGIPEQSRVWWCPTSVFCSLPLHAMGPIPSDHMPKPSKPSKRYFSDLYIPSYTPSLSALIESRKPSGQALDQPSLLLVAQPDQSLPAVWGEIEVMYKLNVPVESLILMWATPTSVIEGLRDHRFAHFACHGNLKTGEPFDASFQLHDGEQLTLLDIVGSRLPNAEFAFLSCCHTAEITEKSIADEALHLTAAMQYCGFRSVVGTMWEMADTDGRDLAENFYKSLFSSREQGVPYYERSARALRDAARKLRRKEGISLERWVNFVHYGA